MSTLQNVTSNSSHGRQTIPNDRFPYLFASCHRAGLRLEISFPSVNEKIHQRPYSKSVTK